MFRFDSSGGYLHFSKWHYLRFFFKIPFLSEGRMHIVGFVLFKVECQTCKKQLSLPPPPLFPSLLFCFWESILLIPLAACSSIFFNCILNNMLIILNNMLI